VNSPTYFLEERDDPIALKGQPTLGNHLLRTEAIMANERSQNPLDLKTGRLVFTPVLQATGERLDLEVDYASFPQSRKLGFHGITQDLNTGKWYAVWGKECGLPGCCCDAWVVEIPAP
jgi:hypothetical protein